jgi:excisionase family DNA binding protein
MPRTRDAHYDATVAELARRLHCSDETIRRLWRTGEIPGIRLKRELRFNTAQVLAALAAAGRDDEDAEIAR